MTTPIEFVFATPEGVPIADSYFEVQLVKSGYNDEETGVLMPRLVEAYTDVNGRAVVDLWPTNKMYVVTVLDPISEAGLSYKFYVPEGTPPGTTLRLQDIVVDGPISDTYWDEEAIQQILAAKAQAQAAKVAAEAARDEAVTAAESVSDVSDLVVRAENAANAADNSKTLANNSAISANNSKVSAENAAALSLTRANAAAASASSASADATQTASDRTAASNSATTASNAASSAGTSATNASNSATTATNAATTAATKASEASNSATTAQTAASTAATDAGEAAISATEAAGSELNAAGSAAQALAYRNTASTHATNAQTSAANSADSAIISAGHANDAENFKNTAETAASNANQSAIDAAASAALSGVIAATIDSSNHLLITRGDNSVLDAGYVKGDKGDPGAGLALKGSVPTVGDLPSTGNQENDAYKVDFDGHLYVWNGTSWTDVGQFQGPPGSNNWADISGKPSFGTAAELNVPAAGNANSTQVVKGNDTRLTDARTPTAHTHTRAEISDASTIGRNILGASDGAAVRTLIGAGTSSFDGNYNNLTNKPDLGTAAEKNVPTSGNAAITEVVLGNDSRLTNSRAPTAHSHNPSDINGITPTGNAVLIAADAAAGRSALQAASAADLANVSNIANSAVQSGVGPFTIGHMAIVADSEGKSITSGGYPLSIGTTGTTAKAGNYVPDWTEVTNKPALATAAQGAKADTAVQTADKATQAQAEAGTNTTAWMTPEQSAQAIAARARSNTWVPTKSDVGLSNVDNTSDANKPISTAQASVNSAQTITNNNLAVADRTVPSTSSNSVSYTVVTADVGGMKKFTAAMPTIVTIPASGGSFVPDTDAIIFFSQENSTGTLTIQAGSGATIRTTKNKSNGQYSKLAIVRDGSTNNWDVIGGVA